MNSSISRTQGCGLQTIPANEDITPPSAIALDRAITNVGSRELERLSQGLSDQEVAKNIEAALKILKGISWGIKSYDEWTSLWYLLWYQASQCNVAAGMLRNVIWPRIQYRLKRNEPRQFCLIDVGSGALNAQLGLSHLITDYPHIFRDFGAITFVGIDISGSMLRLGRLLWNELTSNLAEFPTGPRDYRSNWKFNAIHQSSTDTGKIASLNHGKTEYWISAFNALQGDHKDQVKHQLSTAEKVFNPAVGVFTSSGKKNNRLLSSSIPLSVDEYQFHEIPRCEITTVELNGCLPELANFRRRVYHRYQHYFIDRCMAMKYLTNCPRWEPKNSRGIICVLGGS